MMGLNVHRGWHVFENRSTRGPRFQANRHGVGMCADDLATLHRMIDQRVDDHRLAREVLTRERQRFEAAQQEMREVVFGTHMGVYHEQIVLDKQR